MCSVISGSLSKLHSACSRWRVAVNILNKQIRTADSDVSLASGLGKVLIVPHYKHFQCYEIFHMASDLN
jgi:hypothetical protein